MRRWTLAIAMALAVASPAAAQDLPPQVRKVFVDYGADSRISPCRHTLDELRRARKAIPPDIDQYAPDFPGQVDNAIEAHLRGDCAGKKPLAAAEPAPLPTASAPTPTPTAVATKTVVAEPPQPAVAPAQGAGGGPPADSAATIARVADAEPASGAPAPLRLLGLLAGALALAALLALLAARTTRGREHLERLRHGWREAAFRGSGTWLDFVDWVRAGR